MARFMADFISDATLADFYRRYPNRNRLHDRHGNTGIDKHAIQLREDLYGAPPPIANSDSNEHANLDNDPDGRGAERKDEPR